MAPRTGRLIVDGGVYHVLTRGNNGQTVFHHDTDYRRYLELLSAYAATHGLRVRHFVLMPSHVHLILEPVSGESLSRAMLGLNLAYTLYYQKRYRYRGHLWRGRFTSLLLNRDGELLDHGRYVELHPVRSGLAADPAAYAWSSYRVYADGVVSPLVEPHERYHLLGADALQRREHYRRFILEGLRAQPLDPRLPLGGRRRGRPRKLQPATGEQAHVRVFPLGAVLSMLSRIW
jgi:putative transposase